MDGHKSHEDPQSLEILEQNKIDFLKLPAHTSHFTQPLDISFFRSMKQRLRTAYDLYKGHGALPEYAEASNQERVRILESLNQAIIQSSSLWLNIMNSFETAGIYPCNGALLLENGYVTEPNPPGKKYNLIFT